MISLISTAYAATPGGAEPSTDTISTLLLLVGFVVIFYFLLWRPQQKKAKEHRELVNSLAQDDEVMTSGGVVGRITKLSDNFITLEIAKGVEIMVQKGSVASSLPKGTMKQTS